MKYFIKKVQTAKRNAITVALVKSRGIVGTCGFCGNSIPHESCSFLCVCTLDNSIKGCKDSCPYWKFD